MNWRGSTAASTQSDPPSGKRLSRTRAVGWFMVMLVMSMVMILAVVEAVFRVFIPEPGAWTLGAADDRYHHVLRPNRHVSYRIPNSDYVMDVTTNSLGFRDEEVDPAKPGYVNILALGDSYAFGYAVTVEERFDTILEELLNETGRKYQVINAGVPGWGTIQETQYAKDHFHVLRPDIVVLTFCENDPGGDGLFLRDPEYMTQNFLRAPVRRFLRNSLHSFRFLMRKMHEQKLAQFKRNAELGGRVNRTTGVYISEDEWQRTLERIRCFHEEFMAYNPKGILIVQASYPDDEDTRSHLSRLDNGSTLRYLDMYDEVHRLGRKALENPLTHWSPLMHEVSARNLFELICSLDVRDDLPTSQH